MGGKYQSRFIYLAMAAAAPIAIAAATAPAYAQSAQRSYSIPSQDMGDALRAFALSSGTDVVFDPAVVAGKRSNAVSGSFSSEEALRRLTAGTGLVYRRLASGGFAITSSVEGGAQAKSAAADSSETSWSNQTGEEIVVTGTNIRGGQSIGSNVQIIGRDVIEKSGYATFHQFMQSYVQNYSGGVGEDLTGASNVTNFTEAAAINLRGLGPSATLVLLNGRRLPAAGVDVSFTDISSIPTTAIERVEILTDSGSAVYGTDAVAGAVNIILRKNFEGMESLLRYGSVTSGGLREYLASHIAGVKWGTGAASIALEFNHRDPLGAAERSFTRELDHRSRGGTDQRVEFTNPGNILDPDTFLPAFAIPANQDGRSLRSTDLLPGSVNLGNPYIHDDVIGSHRKYNAFFTGSQEISHNVAVFAELRYGRRYLRTKSPRLDYLFVPSTNAFFVDPFGDSPFLFIAYDLTEDLGPQLLTGHVVDYNAVGGATVDLTPALQLRFFGAYGEQDSQTKTDDLNRAELSRFLADSNPDSAFNPFGDGSNTSPITIDALKIRREFKMNSKMRSLNAVLDGNLADLPGGPIKFAIGGDYQNIEAGFDILRASDRINSGRFSRSVKSAFAEVQVPVFKNVGSEVKPLRLDVSLAGRFDDYSDVGTTFNPRIGARLKAGREFELRGNWGTAFRAPSLGNLNEANNSISAFRVSDTRIPGGSALIFYKSGENAELRNEKANTWTTGLSWRPASHRFEVQVNYFNISFKDRIVPAPAPADVLALPEQYGHLAVVSPTQEQLSAFCALPYRNFADPALCEDAGAIDALVDGRRQNLSNVYVQGVDLIASGSFDLSPDLGLNLSLNSSYLIDYKERAASGTPRVEKIDTIGNPVDLRIQGNASFSYRTDATISVTANYTDSYKDTTNPPFLKIKNWLTFDINASINVVKKKGGIFNDTVLSLSVLNILDAAPPFVNGSRYAYDPANADPVGRLLALSLRKKW